ncbi:probable E3 ubiquitin-protein ligase RHY1A [Nicotiana sylvestris]|uniref:E3 ubiquitin-protein ligase At3g02290-like n=1 Tax=Nicotiana sylvestris TaxID=4096 RepID=A0A1U7WQ16_NICSY|nr:PREDICTED: E3 ubiquitin-protein ligase At3g02290-like [Nicotiana sylvestris]XP_009782031.1 PREDICTED: E3 ubiquitin-protein ligase At3g02290-like [Nicotiana sylvestris]
MAGMLPGIEHARRRRFHQRGSWLDSSNTRRSSFCIYTSNHDQYHLSSSCSKQRSAASHVYQDEKLVEIAREAKQRLDEKLSAQWKSEKKRSTINNRPQRQGLVEIKPILGMSDLHKEVFRLKKSVSKRFINWAKLGWKSLLEQDECAICLDQYRKRDNLIQLSCAHKFHSNCLVPWLEFNSHCPCCRMEIFMTI